MRVLVAHQPAAGRSGVTARSLRSVFHRAGHDVVYRSLEEARWEAGLDEPVDVVVAAGGDGTVRKVFVAVAERSAAVAVVPLGTANNVARTLGVPTSDPVVVKTNWPAESFRPFDLPEVRSRSAATRFVESVGGGLFADLLGLATDGSATDTKRDGLATLARLVCRAPVLPWAVRVDRRDLSGEYLAVEVMNIREIGPNVAIAPDADPGDRLVDVVLIGPDHRAPLLEYLEGRLHDELAAPPDLPRARGRLVSLASPRRARLHVDDQLWGAGPTTSTVRVEVTIPPTTLRVQT